MLILPGFTPNCLFFQPSPNIYKMPIDFGVESNFRKGQYFCFL